MKSLGFGRNALTSCVAAGMLAGCGGSQPPIAAPGVAPQTLALAVHAERGKSWMLREAKGEDLLYASNMSSASGPPYYGDVLVFAYPKGTLVGTLTGFSAYVQGVCSDASGDVFVTAETSLTQGYIYEYSHGGTQSIATLSDRGSPYGCSVDPTTGNLAVANTTSSGYYGYYGDVAIFPDAEGTATTYYDSDVIAPLFCSYDNAGNLYIDGYDGPDSIIGELPSGSGTFTNISLSEAIDPGSLQWNYDVLVTPGGVGGSHGETQIYQIAISGSTGIVSGPISLWSRGNRRSGGIHQFWLQGSTIIGPGLAGGGFPFINFWHYPKGGRPTKVLHAKGVPTDFLALAISNAAK